MHVEGNVFVINVVLVEHQLLLVYAEMASQEKSQALLHNIQVLFFTLYGVRDTFVVQDISETYLQANEDEVVDKDLVIHGVFETVESLNHVGDADANVVA